MKPLRVCHVIHDTQVGGAELTLLELLRNLDPQLVESTVISLMQCGPVGSMIRDLGIPLFALNCASGRWPRPWRLVGLWRKLRQLRPDVVQTWAYVADLVGGSVAWSACGAPVIWNIRHGTLDPRLDSPNTIRAAKLCARLSRAVPKKIIVNSDAAIRIHRRVGYAADNLLLLRNGFDVTRFRPRPAERRQLRAQLGIGPDARLVGMCGRFHPHKGQHDFIRAAAGISRRQPRTRFLLAGQGSDATNKELIGWLAEEQMERNFRLVGCRDDMPQLLAALDVYVLPSITEGLPNVVGQAMSCGVPCVVTDVGDAGWLVGDCGRVVPARNPRALADAVVQVLALPDEERAALGAKARARIVAELDLGRVVARYQEIWRVAAEQRRAAVIEPARAKPRWLTIGDGMHRRDPSETAPRRPKLVHVTTIPMTQWLFLRGQHTFMRETGFDVHAVSSPGADLNKVHRNEMVPVHPVPISRRITPLQDALSMIRLWSLFRKLRPEIVQLSTPKAALLGAIAAWSARVPIRIYQVRGLSSESESGWKRRVFQQLERLTARLCNRHFVNAKSLLDYARQARILRPDEGHVMGMGMSNGVDLARFQPESIGPTAPRPWLDEDERNKQPRGPVIGYVGRMAYDKGLEDLFQAWTELREEFAHACLLLVGPWEAENPVSPVCRDALNRDQRVIIAGPRDDVASFYGAMDLFVFPSHGTEGFPNAPMEAAAMGLPVVATRVVGCVDAVVDGVTGTLVAPQSPNELRAAIRSYLVDSELRRRHGQVGRDRVRQGFEPRRLWTQFREDYIQQLQAAGLPLPIPGGEDQDLRRAA